MFSIHSYDLLHNFTSVRTPVWQMLYKLLYEMDPIQRVSKDKLEKGGRKEAVHCLTTQVENFHRQMKQSSLEHPGNLWHSQYLN